MEDVPTITNEEGEEGEECGEEEEKMRWKGGELVREREEACDGIIEL